MLNVCKSPEYGLYFQKTSTIIFSTNKEVLHKQKLFQDWRSVLEPEIFPWLRKLSTSKYFSIIREVFNNFFSSRNILFIIKDVFQNQWRFPQAKIFSWSNNFFTRKTFHNQGSFPQAKIFSWSRNFLTRKGFTFVESCKSHGFTFVNLRKKYFNPLIPGSNKMLYPLIQLRRNCRTRH